MAGKITYKIKEGFEYEIYLPADECNFKLAKDVWFALQSVQLEDNSGKSQILYDYYNIYGDKQFEFLPENNPTYMIETDCGIFKFNGTKTSLFDPLSGTSETFYSVTIDCRIPVNRSGGERSISLSLGFAMFQAGVTIIQVAE